MIIPVVLTWNSLGDYSTKNIKTPHRLCKEMHRRVVELYANLIPY